MFYRIDHLPIQKLTKKHTTLSDTKTGLHPRNLHRAPYDFRLLCEHLPELAQFVITNPAQFKTIDFSNPIAVKTLNKALLKYHYKIDFWDIPDQYLCPPIPGRSDYIHYMADLLSQQNGANGKSITALDIGTGANCIYPILGNRIYDWKFIGTDIDPVAIKHASSIIEANTNLKNAITIKLQKDKSTFFNNILTKYDKIDVTFCNPPFHSSMEEAMAGNAKKWDKLGVKKDKNAALNFGGKNHELWCTGGENTFVCNMAKESGNFKSTCLWFSTLVSKKTTLASIYYTLEKVGALEVKTIEMNQGQKISRIVAWTFFTPEERVLWFRK